MTIRERISNSLKVFRINEVLPGAGPVIIAAIDSRQLLPTTTFTIALGYLSLFLGSFLINELVDSFDTDKFNTERCKAIVKLKVSRTFALISFLITSAFGLAVLAHQGLIIPAVIGFVILTAYSLPPIRIKARPILDLIAVTIGFVIIPYLSYYLAAHVVISLRVVLVLLFFAFGFCAIDLVAEGADLDADRAAGLSTTAVFLGATKNIFLMRILTLLCVAFGVATVIYTHRWWYVYFLIPVFILHTASDYALAIKDRPGRLQELFTVGGKFGIMVSDIGLIFLVILFWARYFIY